MENFFRKFPLYVIVIVCLSFIAEAKDRPTVGLVLSGGGARGGAHVGILKFLEEKHILFQIQHI